MALVDSTLRVWDVDNGKPVGTWGKNLSDLAFSNDRRCALATHTDGRYEALDLATGKSLAVYPKPAKERKPLAVDPQRHYLVYLKDKALRLELFETGEETVLGDLPGDEVSDVALAADGETLAVADGSGGISLWDITDKKKLAEKREGSKPAGRLNFAPDGSTLAYAQEGSLHVWTLGEAAAGSVETKHPFGIADVAFSNDSRTIATTGRLMDPSIKVWNVPPPGAPKP